jgi:hypothetical protein
MSQFPEPEELLELAETRVVSLRAVCDELRADSKRLQSLLDEGAEAVRDMLYAPPTYGQLRTPLELQRLQSRVDQWLQAVAQGTRSLK